MSHWLTLTCLYQCFTCQHRNACKLDTFLSVFSSSVLEAPSLSPACQNLPTKRTSHLLTDLSPGSSQSSRKNRILLQPATRLTPLTGRLVNRLWIIPTLFPSLAYSGLSLSLSPSVYVFLHRPSHRFSTRREIVLNALGLIAAVAAGAAQVCFLGRPFLLPYSSLPDGCFGSLS
jgi:hypothetical protein